MTWYPPIEQGGTPVIDYRIRVSLDEGASFTDLVDGLTGTSYTATGLTEGVIYTFKVQARNGIGYGEFTEPLSVLAASPPNRPTAPTTTWTRDLVTITW